MKGRSIVMLGLGVVIALTESAGVVYGMTGQTVSPRVASVSMMTSSMMGGNNSSITPAANFLTAVAGLVILLAGGVVLARRRRRNLS